MPPSDRVRLHLDVDLASEPIEGEIHAEGRPSRAFAGWLGLTSALERAVADGQRDPAADEAP